MNRDPLRYSPEYEVEIHDHVEVLVDGIIFDGQVRKVHPRCRQVTVHYEDHLDLYRTTGNPREKTARVNIGSVALIRRDG